MAQIETVTTAAATSTEAGNTTLNPVQTAPNRINVYPTLEFVGVNYDPAALYAALDAAYGTVAENKVNARGAPHFVIST